MTNKEYYNQLKDKLNDHAHRYYALDDPIIPDAKYDDMFRELKAMETLHPELVAPDSPTHRIGGARLDGFKPFIHVTPMLSLDNAMSAQELDSFLTRARSDMKPGGWLVAEPKVDGLSIEVVYKNGFLDSAGTRGDGLIGEDVTHNVRTIRNVPLRLEYHPGWPVVIREFEKLTIRVRGEVYIPKKDFDDLNKARVAAGEPEFANARNAAAGALRQLDPKVASSRRLKAVFYDISVDGYPEHITSQEYVYSALRSLRLPTFGMNLWGFTTHSSTDSVMEAMERFNDHRDEMDFEIDGVVIKVGDFYERAIMGETSHHPKYAIAFKFPAEEAKTLLEGVNFQVGRTGVITPVAVLKSVKVGGAMVTYATLHNEARLEELNLHYGDEVTVRRAGEVIPEIVSAKRGSAELGTNGDKVRYPYTCPCCSSDLTQTPGEAAIRCPNKSCPDQLKASIEHFGSRKAMDIEGLGEETVSLLVDRGLVHSIEDLYRLGDSDLLALDGFQTRKAQKLVDAIHGSKGPDLAKFIFALGIPLVGSSTAKDLANIFTTMDMLAAATEYELMQIDGIGPNVARSIVEYFENKSNFRTVSLLLQYGVKPVHETKEPSSNSGGFWSGKTVVITGTLSMSRDYAAKIIEQLGGKITGSVSKKTDCVLAGANPGSKFQRAKDLGITIMAEDEFKFLI